MGSEEFKISPDKKISLKDYDQKRASFPLAKSCFNIDRIVALMPVVSRN